MESFAAQAALTGNFRHGRPRSFRCEGSSVWFLSSDSGRSPVLSLWRWRDGAVTRVIDGSGETEFTQAERDIRQRRRESATGITTFDVVAERVVAIVSGEVVTWEPGNGITATGIHSAFDLRISPDGRRFAWVADGSLWVRDFDGGEPTAVVTSEDENVTWGIADFIAAEELGRTRGYWWLPDSGGLLVTRVDSESVDTWYHTNLLEPWESPRSQKYPAAGTTNASVELWQVGLSGHREQVDLAGAEYLVSVRPPLVSTFDRAQRNLQIVDLYSGEVEVVRGQPWVDVCPGVPDQTPAGDVVSMMLGQTRRITLNGEPVTPAKVHVRSVLAVHPEGVYVSASGAPAECRIARAGKNEWEWLTPADRVCTAVVGDELVVVTEATWDRPGVETTVRNRDFQVLGTLPSYSETPAVRPRPLLLSDAPGVQTVVLMPQPASDHPLPILMTPYGGPHAQRVLADNNAYLTGQHLADQGFCVVIADGRGTPGQDLPFEHAIAGDLATGPLADQITALGQVVDRLGDAVDASRVGIVGWSFGGYLAALAVLQRPDVFHAAIAGAPVTDWQLYDTAYTERYLGHPDEDPAAYVRSSLIPLATSLERPLLLIHGLSDDNVFPAHSFALSKALFAAGRQHLLLPLADVTHMASDPTVAEHLIDVQVEFFRTHLGAAVARTEA